MDSMIKIDKNIPVKSHRDDMYIRDPLYPWAQMESGDSFLVDDRKMVASARMSLIRYKKLGRVPANYGTRTGREGNKIRIWLVEE
jgi:hypothetical protein